MDMPWGLHLLAIHFSRIQVLFADNMHRCAGVDNKFSFLRCKIWQATFSDGEKNVALFFSLNLRTFGQFPRCFTGSLLLPLRLLQRPTLKIWSVGGYVHEVHHLGISIRAKDFSLECQRDVQRLSWILHVGSVSVCPRRLRRLHILDYATPIVVHFMSRIQRVSRSIVWLMLLQHGHCTFVTIFCLKKKTFCLADHQPDDVHIKHFPRICNHSWSCKTSVLEGATFYRMSYCKFLCGNPCRAIETFTTGTFSSGTSGSRRISLFLVHERIWRRIRLCHLHAYENEGNCNCLL